jgi:hypothetical protein
MIRPIVLAVVLAFLGVTSAFAQVPSVQGQMPGTLPPAPPPVAVPPPPVAPPPVPSVVTPLPSPTYGVPRGVTSPVVGSYSSVYRARAYPPQKKKKRPTRRHPRVSEIHFVRMI